MKVFWIARRELVAMFTTAIGWLVLTAFLLVTGFFWFSGVALFVEQSAQATFDPYAASQLKISRLVGEFFGTSTIVLVMLVPAISMRLFSEELKSRSLELLRTSPVSTTEIVLGKYLGAMGFLATMMLCTLHYPLGLGAWADPHWEFWGVGYLSLMMLGSALMSIGMVFSAYNRNQIVASVQTLGVALPLFVLGALADTPDDLSYRLGIASHLNDVLVGLVRLSDLVYFAVVTAVCLFVTHQRLESFRWR